MDANKRDSLVRKINLAVRGNDYPGCRGIMQEIFSKSNKVELLSFLAGVLPSIAFNVFFVSNMNLLGQLNFYEYRDLLSRSTDDEIALYNLTRFLIEHGCAKINVLEAIGVDMDRARRVDLFKLLTENIGNMPPAIKEFNERLYKDCGVSISEVSAFKFRIDELGARN